MNPELISEIKEENQYEDRSLYDCWYTDKERILKEDFLMNQSHETLKNWIIDREVDINSFFEDKEEEWEQYKEEQFNIYIEARNEP